MQLEKDKNIKLSEELKFEKEKNINLNNKLLLYKNTVIELNSKLNCLKSDLVSKNLEIEKIKKYYKDELNKLNPTSSLEYCKPGEKIMAINFISTDHKIMYCLPCKNTDIFVRLEEKLYDEFPEYKEENTYFTVNGNTIKRFKSMEDNKIKNSDVIILNIYE